MGKTDLGRWTRDGILNFSWSPFETFDKLVFSPHVKEKLTRKVEIFLSGREEFHSLRLPWRYGLFFFGPSGCGKTACGRAIARALDWYHFTIPAHEILDSHFFEKALAEAVSEPHRVIVLEDVDRMVRSMEPEVFFTLLDHALERADGTFWIANTRHPEDAPKIQLLRPGRFDEAVRLEPPHSELRLELLTELLLPQKPQEGDDLSLLGEGALKEWTEQTSGLTFSHFEELRQIVARMKLEKLGNPEISAGVRAYIEDQMIAGDRWGGVSDTVLELNQRVKQIDSRLLMAALDMTDVFRRLIEKVIGDAAEQSKAATSTDES